jgi:hypothetical protein
MEPHIKDVEQIKSYSFARANEDDRTRHKVVSIAHDRVRHLTVRSHDIFLATFWATAPIAHRLIEFQKKMFVTPSRRFIYLIQDFEPGFYPWSSDFVLAESTYVDYGPQTIAVFNTALLRDFFIARDYQFWKIYSFEPRLNPQLRAALIHSQGRARERKRQILIYGRPSKNRNGFWLIVEGLRHWASTHPSASTWDLVSVGEPHPSVTVARGVQLRSMGKVSLPSYGDLLSESAIGISIMLSPHPSYPPLEMTYFGLLTITNSFANKDLGKMLPNCISVSSCTPEGIGTALKNACDMITDGWIPENCTNVGSCFLEEATPYAFLEHLIRDIDSMIQAHPTYSSALERISR